MKTDIPFRIDPQSEKSQIDQIERDIMHCICRQDLKRGEALPSLRDIAHATGANINTVVKVFGRLSESHIIRTSKGQPARVTDLADRISAQLCQRDIDRRAAELMNDATAAGLQINIGNRDSQAALEFNRKGL